MQPTSYKEEVETVGISRLDKHFSEQKKKRHTHQKKRHKENRFWDIVSEETHRFGHCGSPAALEIPA